MEIPQSEGGNPKQESPDSHRIQISNLLRSTAAATPERWVGAGIDHVPVGEEIRKLRRRLREFWMTVEYVRHAGKGMQFGRDLRVLQHPVESFAALERDRGVLGAVKQYRRNEIRDVGGRGGGYVGRLIASLRK